MPPPAILSATGARYGRPDGAWCFANEQPGLKVSPSVQWPVEMRVVPEVVLENHASAEPAPRSTKIAPAARRAMLRRGLRRRCEARPLRDPSSGRGYAAATLRWAGDPQRRGIRRRVVDYRRSGWGGRWCRLRLVGDRRPFEGHRARTMRGGVPPELLAAREGCPAARAGERDGRGHRERRRDLRRALAVSAGVATESIHVGERGAAVRAHKSRVRPLHWPHLCVSRCPSILRLV